VPAAARRPRVRRFRSSSAKRALASTLTKPLQGWSPRSRARQVRAGALLKSQQYSKCTTPGKLGCLTPNTPARMVVTSLSSGGAAALTPGKWATAGRAGFPTGSLRGRRRLRMLPFLSLLPSHLETMLAVVVAAAGAASGFPGWIFAFFKAFSGGRFRFAFVALSEEGAGLECLVAPTAFARIGDIAGNLGLIELVIRSVLLVGRLRRLLFLLFTVPTPSLWSLFAPASRLLRPLRDASALPPTRS